MGAKIYKMGQQVPPKRAGKPGRSFEQYKKEKKAERTEKALRIFKGLILGYNIDQIARDMVIDKQDVSYYMQRLRKDYKCSNYYQLLVKLLDEDKISY